MAERTQWLRHRGVLVGASLLALVAASSAIAVWAATRLPPPEHARGRDLVRWLVMRDLREESEATRRALVLQLELYLQDAAELSATTEMDAEQRWNLQSNVAVLLADWLRISTERFQQLEFADRAAYLDQQLRLVERVCELGRLWSHSAEDTADSEATVELVATVERAVAQAPRSDRQQFELYVRAMKVRWLATVDLSQFGNRAMETLANHIEGELRGGFLWDDTEENLDSARSEQLSRKGQLWRNADLLAEVWFHRQVATYARVPPYARSKYMTQFIADVTSWPIVKQRLEPAAAENLATANPFGLLMNNRLLHAMKQMSALEESIEVWIRRAPQSSQPDMRKFVADARTAIRNHYLKQLVPNFSLPISR
jgi:hypothetical protein